MWRLLLGGVLLTAAAEVIVFILLVRTIGFWPTSGLVLFSMAAGGWLAKRQGLAALRRWPQTLAAGTAPGLALIDGVLVLVAGLCLLLPGLLTDIPGLLLLIPPVRHLVARIVARYLIAHYAATRPAGTTATAAAPRRTAHDAVIDVRAERVETENLPPAPPPD